MTFLALLWFFATIATLAGLLFPAVFKRKNAETPPKRKQILKIGGGISLALFLAIAIFAPPLAGTLTDPRDGSVYKTIVIGSQTWMAENLNYEYKVNGSTYGNWCYNDSAKYCAQYGRLYTWASAMDTAITGCGDDKTCAASRGRVQGICPEGWHLPDSAEWEMLFSAVGGASTAGKSLKSSGGWKDALTSSGNGTDSYGFSALPGGIRLSADGEIVIRDFFAHAGSGAKFWSSSQCNPSSSKFYQRLAYEMALYNYLEKAYLDDGIKSHAYSIRCVKD